MNRKSDGPSIQWSHIVITWVNLFEKETLSKISTVKNSKFFVETIKAIYEFNGLKDVSFKNNDELAVKFVKEYFPEIIKEKRFVTKNEDDVLILISLLMYTTCVKYKIQEFLAKTCTINLDDNHQEAMKKFFEVMLSIEDGNFTRRNVMDAIQQCFEPVAVTGARKSLSPSVQRNCLKEFLGSPLLQEKYKRNKEENDVKHLNALLQEENSELMSEKETLILKNQELEVSVKKLQTNLNEKTQEIVSLREELWLHENRETTDVSCSKNENSQNQEIDQLKNDLKEIQSINENLLQENGNFIKQICHLKAEMKGREDDIIDKIKIIDELQQKLQDLERNNIILQSQVEELKKIIEQFKEERSPKEELNMSAPRVEENIGQVLFDIELKEKEEVINRLQENLKSLELVCEEKNGEMKQLEISKRELESKLQSKCSEFEDLNHALSVLRQQVDALSAQKKTLEEELSLVSAKTQALEKEMKETNEQTNHKMADKDSQLSLLQADVHTLNVAKSELERQIEDQIVEIKQLEISKKELESKLQSKCCEFEELNHAGSALQQKVDALSAQKITLEEELSLASAKTQALEKEMKETSEQLNHEMAEKDSQLAQLQADIHALEVAKSEIESQIEDQTCKIKQLETSKIEVESKLQQQVSELLNKNKTLEEEFSLALTQTEALKKEMFEFNQLFNHQVEEKDLQLQAVINSLETENKEIKTQIEDQTIKLKQLETSKIEVESKLQHQIGELLRKHKTLEEELTLATAKTEALEKEMYESNQQLNHEVVEKDSRLLLLQADNHALKMSKSEIETQINNQKDQIKQLEMNKKELESKLRSKCCEFEDLTRASSELQQQVDALSTEKKKLEEELSLSVAKTQALEKQIFESNQQLNHEMAEKDSQLSLLQADIHALEMSKSEIETQIEDQTCKIKQLETSKIEVESKLQQQVSELSSKNKTLEEELSLALTKMEALEKQIFESNQQFNHHMEERDSQLQAVINSLETENKEIKTQIEDQAGIIKQFKTSEINLQQEVADLIARSTALKGELSVALATSQDLETKMHKSKQQLNRELADRDAHVAELQTVICTLETEKEEIKSQLNQEFADKDAQVTQLQTVICTLETEKEEIKSQLSQEITDKNAQVTQLQTVICTLETEKEEIKSQLNQEITDKDAQVTQLQTVICTLEMEKEEVKSQLEDQSAKINLLGTAITELETKLQSKSCELEQITRLFDELSTKNTTSEQELSLALAKSQELENKMREFNEELNQAISEKDSQLEKLQVDVQTLKVEKEEIKIQFGEKVSSLEVSLKESNKLITEKEGVLENLQTQLNIKSDEIEQLKEEVKILVTDKERLNDVLKQVEAEHSSNQQSIEDLINENTRYKNDLEENLNKLMSVEQEYLDKYEKVIKENKHLKKQLEDHDPQLKEAYEKLFDDYHRLNGECDELKSNLENIRASVKAEYEEILKKMKSHMKTTCTQALEKKEEKHAKVLRDLQNVVKANQEHISQLSTNLWDTSDKLLITRNENEELKKTVADLTRALSLHQSAPNSMQRTRSHDHLGFQNHKALRMVEEETVTMSRRQSLRTVPSGIGKVFPSEDEAEEMFSNNNLADLKAGRCMVEAGDPDRVSTLMYRNSLCPPHLKSSYPAETQFLPIDTLHEDDIKGRGLGDDAKLLPDRALRRKDRSQATELKNVATPRSALRELNDENRKPGPGTPSRIFSNLFSARQRRSEVAQSTPDRRRLSFFGRHFIKKEPSE